MAGEVLEVHACWQRAALCLHGTLMTFVQE